MTVIKENKVNIPNPNSNNSNGVSLYTLDASSASSTDSLVNEIVIRATTTASFNRRLRVMKMRQHFVEEPIHLTKNAGKKKIRRYQNRCILQTLLEDELENAVTAVLVEPSKSYFTILLEDSEALRLWNDFINKSEEEQSDILQAFNNKSNLSNEKHDRISATDRTLGWVSSRVKRTIKSKKNLSIESVKNSEDEIIAFFMKTPKNIYIKYASTSFDRLLTKTIARYHGLQFKTVISTEENVKPTIEVFNTKKNWIPANYFLTDLIQQLK